MNFTNGYLKISNSSADLIGQMPNAGPSGSPGSEVHHHRGNGTVNPTKLQNLVRGFFRGNARSVKTQSIYSDSSPLTRNEEISNSSTDSIQSMPNAGLSGSGGSEVRHHEGKNFTGFGVWKPRKSQSDVYGQSRYGASTDSVETQSIHSFNSTSPLLENGKASVVNKILTKTIFRPHRLVNDREKMQAFRDGVNCVENAKDSAAVKQALVALLKNFATVTTTEIINTAVVTVKIVSTKKKEIIDHSERRSLRSAQKQALAVWEKHFPSLDKDDQTALLQKFTTEFLPHLLHSGKSAHDAQRRGIDMLSASLLKMKDQKEGRAKTAVALFHQIKNLSTKKHSDYHSAAGCITLIGSVLATLPLWAVSGPAGFFIVMGAATVTGSGVTFGSLGIKNRTAGVSLITRELKHIRSVWQTLDNDTKNMVMDKFKLMRAALEDVSGHKIDELRDSPGKYMTPENFDKYWEKKNEGSNLEKFRMHFRK